MNWLILLVTTVYSVLAEDGDLQSFHSANQQFSSQFLSEVVKVHPNDNVVVSGMSVLPPLAILSLNALGKTKTEIQDTIHLKNDDVLKNAMKASAVQLGKVRDVTLKFANRLYISKDGSVDSNFGRVDGVTLLNSSVEYVDFSKPKSAAANINAWVEHQTNKKIKDFVNENQLAGSKLVIVNAVYFKGSWQTKFDAEKTKNLPFHVTPTKTVEVPMMQGRITTQYGKSKELDAQLVELKYENNDGQLLIVMPEKVDGLKDLLKKLNNPEILANTTKQMFLAEVDVVLPKFKVETSTDLKDVLKNMGIQTVFTDNAELSSKASEKLKVGTAVQKAFIEVNEYGTEAAAATAVLVLGASLFGPPKESMTIDRPFYFELQVKDEVVFSGLVVQP